MAKIRKLNVSEITGTSPYNQDDEAVMPSGTVVVYEKDNNGVIEYVLRVHDGVTNGGVAISPGPGPVIFNGSDGIVPSNLNDGIAAVFNNGEVYITGGRGVRFTGLDADSGGSTSVLRFWNAEGRHSSGNDPTELVTLNVGNDAAPGEDTLGFFKIITEKETGGEKEWKFDADGVLTLPTGGDIVDSTGASVLGGGSGGDPNIWIQTFASADGYPGDVVVLASSVEYDNAGNIIALFAHQTGIGEFNVPSGSYFSVAKFTAAGQKLWQVRLAAGMGTDVYTDGWGLAVDNVDGRIYVAGRVDDEANYSKSSLIKLDSEDGSLIWSNVYDFGAASDSPVVDVDSEGNPIVVGFYSTEEDTNDGVTVTKIDSQDGSIIWSRLLDGQNDDEAYGMAVGPNNEVVAIGYTAQIGIIDAVEELYTDPVNNLLWTTGGSISVSGFTADFTFTDGVPTFTNVVDTVGGRTVDDTIVTVLGSAIGGVDGDDDMVVRVATVAANDEDDRMLVVKYDTTGTIQWQKAIQFDADYDCYGADADIDSQGNVYVCGSYDYAGDGDTNSAMHLVKFDSSGVKQWSRRVAGPCEDFATSIVVGPDDTLYLSGVTGSFVDDSPRYVWVVAKYTTSGTVVWQRLIENTTGWTFGGAGFFSSAGGSNLAVGEGYVALSGGFGEPFNNDTYATLVQIDADGTVFDVGDWEFKAASFSGTLNSDASDITVIDAGKTDSDMASGIDRNSTLFDIDTTDFLIPTLYSAGGAGSELTNGAYTVALGNTGTVTLPAGGTITEGVVTSNPTIQLTPANPTVASQKLVIKGGAQFSAEDNGIFLTWNEINPQVTDTVNIVVVANAYASQTLYWWIHPAEAGIADPGSGIVEIDGSGNGVFTFTVNSDDYEFTVRVSPEDNNYDPDSIGVETQLFNADSPTFGDHHLHLTTGDLTETSIIVGTDDHNVRTTVDGGIEINTYLYPSGGGSGKWTFDNEGVLTLPGGNTRIGEVYGAGNDVILGSTGTAFGVLTQGTGGYTALQWIDNIENIGTTSTQVAAVIVNSTFASTSGTVQILTGVSNGPVSSNIWEFGADGSLTLPAGGDILDSNGDSVLGGGGGDATGVSRSDDNLIIRLTDPNDDGLELRSLVVNGSDMDVSSTVLGVNGLIIRTNSNVSQKEWQFDNDGDITLPAGGNVVDSVGVSQLANRVEGSWTLPDDSTDTYSFTVPGDGTYVMWVKGNIPNGIITWNATVSVSNTNVPAIGTQYAWNYTGGGSPIALTSLPDQIKGVAGTISTDATYAGTTSNRFDFGISNSSGAEQTVYYGYTKIS